MPWNCPVCKTELADELSRCECGAYRPRPKSPSPSRVSADPTVADHLVKPPVARRCPGCGSDRYRKVKPRTTVAFAKNRVCLDCQTRYTPPTPIWGAVVFLGAGGLLAGAMGLAILVRLSRPNPCGIPAMIIEGLIGLMGVYAFVHGVRILFFGQNEVTPPPLPADPDAQSPSNGNH